MKDLIFNSVYIEEQNLNFVDISGRLDSISCSEFEDFVLPLVTEDVSNITFDFKSLDYISSSGLRVFILLSKTVYKYNGQIVIKNCSSFVKSIFEVSGLLSFFIFE